MRHEREFSFTYRDLAKITGLTPNTISQHVSRGHVDPDTLESLALYLAGYANESLRLRMVITAIGRDIPDDPGGWKRKRGEVEDDDDRDTGGSPRKGPKRSR